MEQKQSIKLPGQSLAYLLMCGLGVLAFIAIGPYSSRKSLGALEMKITKIRSHIEEQKALSPVYNDLLEKMRVKGSDILPSPIKSRLPQDKTEEIPIIFREIAKKCNLDAVSIIPDVKSLDRDSGFLLVNAFVKGNFFDFRKFLIELGKVSYLEHIEEIHIQETIGGKELRLKIWLALN